MMRQFSRLGLVAILLAAIAVTVVALPMRQARSACDPSYPSVCIALPPPDLDCADIPYSNFAVRQPDPHRFDGDGDGLGCETP